jgi:hypothetical protein
VRDYLIPILMAVCLGSIATVQVVKDPHWSGGYAVVLAGCAGFNWWWTTATADGVSLRGRRSGSLGGAGHPGSVLALAADPRLTLSGVVWDMEMGEACGADHPNGIKSPIPPDALGVGVSALWTIPGAMN